jgi:hypothetical protein
VLAASTGLDVHGLDEGGIWHRVRDFLDPV